MAIMSPGEILADKRKNYALALDGSLKRVLQQLAGMPQVERVVLFGSYAEGRRDLFTDLDLLVIMTSDEDFITRTTGLYRTLDIEVDLDLLVYTPEEVERQKQCGFIQHIFKTGKVVYEKKAKGGG